MAKKRPCLFHSALAVSLGPRLFRYSPTSGGAPLGLALEEQGLADDRRDGRRLERLGDQERRLRPLAGQEPFRIRRDEDHWHFEGLEQLVDGIQPGTAVG